jgi:hypothetical protein
VCRHTAWSRQATIIKGEGCKQQIRSLNLIHLEKEGSEIKIRNSSLSPDNTTLIFHKSHLVLNFVQDVLRVDISTGKYIGE